MFSLILSSATRLIVPLMLVFSVFVLLRGHNEPGGGFVGGLVAASGFSLYSLAFGVDRARAALRLDPQTLVALGLGLALASGLVGVAAGLPLMTGRWLDWPVPVLGKLGTPVLFDAGVYLAVTGVTLSFLFSLAAD